jgi:predicted metal-dependent peptidase
MNQHIAERVLKARAVIMSTRLFYGTLIANVEPKEDPTIPTMATDGRYHYYNPDFIEKLSQRELEAVVIHEAEHDARHHHTRRGTRDPMEWNIAADLAINPDLMAEGFQLPKGALFERRFAGLSVEDIYRIREIEKQKQPQGGQGQPGQGNPTSGQGQPAQGQPQPGQGTSGGHSPSTGDPGGCGEVLDAAPGEAGKAEAERRWETIVRQAAALAKKRGDLPGHWTEIIEQENAGQVDWRETLRAWFDSGSLKTSTWNNPNRRFIGRGMIMPGVRRDGLNKVGVLVDTSGSMDTEALRSIAEETQAALDDGAIDSVVVVYNDVQVNRVDEYNTGDQIEFDPKGRGGTDLRPGFEYLEERGDCSMIVCFTDLEIGDPGPEPSAPVLFAVYGAPQTVRHYLDASPWGAPGIDVGAH